MREAAKPHSSHSLTPLLWTSDTTSSALHAHLTYPTHTPASHPCLTPLAYTPASRTVLTQAAVAGLELRLRGPMREAAWRVVVSLPTGHEHGEEHVDVYREVVPPPPTAAEPTAAVPPQQLVYQAALTHCPAPQMSSSPNSSYASLPAVTAGAVSQPVTAGVPNLHGTPVLGPYPPLEKLQQRRLAARRHNVT